MRWLRVKWIEHGRQIALSEMIEKFEDLHSEYFAMGEHDSADLIVELVAYLQNDPMRANAKIEAGRER